MQVLGIVVSAPTLNDERCLGVAVEDWPAATTPLSKIIWMQSACLSAVECPPFHRTVRLGLSASRNSAGERMRSAECGWTVL